MSSSDWLNALQWPAMVITLVAAWWAASNRRGTRWVGFCLYLASNALWIAWGLQVRAWALVALQIGLVVMNLRGVLKAGSPSGQS